MLQSILFCSLSIIQQLFQVDTIFHNGMLSESPAFSYETGYYGSVVLSFFKTSESQTGPGRKKRGIQVDGTGVELELSFRSSSVSAENIDIMFDTGNVTELIGTLNTDEAECDESNLEFDSVKLVLKKSDSGKVSVGMKAYFDCASGYSCKFVFVYSLI